MPQLPPSRTAAPEPVCVLVHAHYPEIWREMAALLAVRMNAPFRLLVTTPHDPALIAVPDSPHLVDHQVLPVENRGRDILPFLRALAVAGEFTVGLKLHTKKSPQRPDGGRWRAEILDSLVPSGFGPGGAPGPGTAAAAIRDRMLADPRIGFVCPAGFALNVPDWVLVNRSAMERVVAATGPDLVEADMEDAFFAAGSMFWFRRRALLPLAAPAVLDLFEPEEGQLDGTAAHATERLFPVIARRQGFRSLSMTALEASRPGMDDAALARLARDGADIANVYFPAPGRAVASVPG